MRILFSYRRGFMAAQCVTRGKNGRNITSHFVVSIERGGVLPLAEVQCGFIVCTFRL